MKNKLYIVEDARQSPLVAPSDKPVNIVYQNDCQAVSLGFSANVTGLRAGRGTGKTATADQAEEVCGFIRATLAKIYDQATADAVTIQYGGSMNAKNCAELLAKPNVDGGLIGGASLKADDFNTIVQAAVNG